MSTADIPEVLKIAKDVDGFKVSEERESFWSKEQLERWVQSDDVLLVAELDGRIVGFVLTTHHKPTGKVIWENQLVLPEFRGQGVAQALTEEMEGRLKESGATYIHFLVKETNEFLHHYKKIGYDAGHKFVWFGKFI
ncbi:MAG: GNAT family N-acetyltransferase [bacterium]|nr:GNAT family N-acetyltransferase [bacterium]